jgi:hypothetical protein
MVENIIRVAALGALIGALFAFALGGALALNGGVG